MTLRAQKAGRRLKRYRKRQDRRLARVNRKKPFEPHELPVTGVWS